MASIASLGRVSQLPWHANMTELNHLGKMLNLRPTVFKGKMNQLFSSQQYYSDNPLSSIAWKNGSEKVISTMEWEWQLRGAYTKPLIVIENVEPATNTTPGQGRTEFKLKLDENWYLPGDNITPGKPDILCRVMSSGSRHGNGWLYSVRLVSDDFQAFLDPKYLQPGQMWSKTFATYGEASNQDGSTQYSTPITFKDSLGKLRKKMEITDYAFEEILAVEIADRDGKMHKTWVNYAETEFWKQWYCERELSLWYNKKANSILDTNARAVNSFSGVQEKLKDSHLHYYTDLTTKLITEFLMDIFYSRVKPGSKRSVKAFTGEYGMLLFNEAIQNQADKRGIIIANANFSPIQKENSEYNKNAYSFGYQFVKYIMPNGAELELIHNPCYDNRTINTEIDPVTGYPVESMRFTFLDFSGDSGNSNIQVVTKKDGYKFGYVAGLVSPYGPNKGGLMSHNAEHYSMHVSEELGIHIEDITKCGELILRRNSA